MPIDHTPRRTCRKLQFQENILVVEEPYCETIYPGTITFVVESQCRIIKHKFKFMQQNGWGNSWKIIWNHTIRID